MLATLAKLIARRLLAAIPILLIVSALLFCVLRLLPVDPAAMSLPPTATIAQIEAKRREMGSLVASTLPATIELAAVAMIIAAGLGLGGGLLLFSLRGTWFESVTDLGSILLLSIPEFLWGLILLFVFGVVLHALPFTGEVSPNLPQPHITGFILIDALLIGRFDVFWSACQHLILPAFALGLAFSPAIMRVLRSSLFDIYHEDYIQQARLRGLSERQILLRHALKNAALPTLTLAGVQFGILFSG